MASRHRLGRRALPTAALTTRRSAGPPRKMALGAARLHHVRSDPRSRHSPHPVSGTPRTQFGTQSSWCGSRCPGKCGPGATAAGERRPRSGRAVQRDYIARRRDPACDLLVPRLMGTRRCPPPARQFRQRGVPLGDVTRPRRPRLPEGRTALAPPRRRVGPKPSPGLVPVPQPPGKRA